MKPLARKVAFLFTATAFTATVLVAGAVVTPAAAGPVTAEPAVSQEFKADSGDRCQYGYTTGVLAWRTPRPTIYSVVDVKGMVVDRPNRSDPGVGCADDGGYTAAGFIAYNGRTVVDSAVVRIDNGSADVGLTLGETSSTIPTIERVVVQICRYSSAPVGISYCGSPQTYLPV